MKHMQQFMQEIISVADSLDYQLMDDIAAELANLRIASGRLFILGVGGSAANAAHAVNDFRKLCGLESYAPTDNVSELTARTNDEGWETVFSAWLKVSKLSNKDALLIFSVGGGNAERGVSVNLVRAIDEAKAVGARIFGIVGRDGGYTKKMGDKVVVVPNVNNDRVTPHAEAFQAVIWHGLVSHPVLQIQSTKW
jgi:D-sedoheptulose 7-phosphate isomerase